MNVLIRLAAWSAAIGLTGLAGIATTTWSTPAPACFLFGLLAGTLLVLGAS